MKKLLPVAFLIITLISCNQKVKTDTTSFVDTAVKENVSLQTIDSSKADSTKKLMASLAVDTIHAGVSIAQLHLNQTFDEAMQIMADPTMVDTTKKTLILHWKINSADTIQHFTTAIFESGKSAKKIKQINTTSPNFKTPEQVGVGSTLAFLKVQYPTLKKPILISQKNSEKKIEVYDEVKEGIAFEVNDEGKCTLVSVHVKGQKYIPVSL